MKAKFPNSPSLAALAASAVAAEATRGATAESVPDLIKRIQSKDDDVRGDAWQGAAPYGAAAMGPLADVMTDPDFEIARSARRAMWKIVRHAGRPGAREERRAVQAALIPLLDTDVVAIKREVLWMLSEIGGNRAIPPIARLLNNEEVRDDARMALQRIPGDRATEALNAALETVPESFRYNIAEALRKRGVAINQYPSQKLVPKD